MAYLIYKSDGTEVIIQDGVSSEPFSIDFVGRNTVNYGATIATTQLHLLENFANTLPPGLSYAADGTTVQGEENATTGQLWYDTARKALFVNTSETAIRAWEKLISAEVNNDIGTVTDPYNVIYANMFMGKQAGSPSVPFDKIYAKDFYGGNFTGNFFGNITSATTATTLANTRIVNVTGGSASGSVNLNLNSNMPAPYTVNLPLTVNKLSTPVLISLTGGVTGSAPFDGSAGINIPVTVISGSHTHNMIIAANDSPTNLNVSSPALTNTSQDRATKTFLTSTQGITGSGSNTSYSDFLVINTGTSTTGMVNALEFDKQTKTIRHWQAAQGAANWGTPRTLAYTDDSGTGTLTPGFSIALSGLATGVSPVSNGSGVVNVNVTAVNDSSKLPLAGGNVTGVINTTSMIAFQGGNASFNYGLWNDFGGNLNISKLIKSTNAYNTSLASLTDTGTLLAAGNVGAFSDARLKENVEIIPDALNKVCSLRGVVYDRIDTKERQTGVIAQELREVLPEAVMEASDENKTLSVAYGNMAGLFIEAIKEMREEIDALKTELKKFQN